MKLGDSSACRGSEADASRRDLTAGVMGQRFLQVPNLQLCPDPVPAAVKVGSQPLANVYLQDKG